MATEVYFRSGSLNCTADLYLPADLKAGEQRPGIVVDYGFASERHPRLGRVLLLGCQ